jgi:thiol-disulfide isomerase/thioredoxin
MSRPLRVFSLFFFAGCVLGAEPKDLRLFLLIGQSNMAGRGVVEAQDREPIPNVYALGEDLTWRPAVDPLHFDKPTIAGVGIGRSFARRVLEQRPGAGIGLIPCAFGGTSLNEWSPGGKLFQDAVRRTREAMKAGKLAGILWHQGEADSADMKLASSYAERFSKVIEALRRELGSPATPVVAGGLGEFLHERKGNPQPFASVVNEQLAQVPRAVPASAFVTSKGLVHKGDQVHFDSASLRELGRRYADAYLKLPIGADVCEAAPEIRQELKRFDIKDVAGQKRRDLTRQIAEELAAKHPTDLFILERYERTMHGGGAEARRTASERLEKLAAEHSGNPGFAALYARSLVDTDTPRALELLKKAPAHPFKQLTLADIYSYGKFADRPQARIEIDAHFTACPNSIRGLTLLKNNATPEMAKTHAARLREILKTETDPERLPAWESVWNLEFKAKPPAEHEALRKQIAADVARLEGVDVPVTEQWLGVLLSGYKQANDTQGAARIEQKLISEYRKGWPARSVVRERWQKDHPWPKPGDPDEKKQEFYRALLARSDGELKEMPGDFETLMNRFSAVKELNDSTPEEVGKAGDEMLAALRKGADWSAMPPFEWQIAQAFLKHKTRADQAPGLVEEGWKAIRERDEWKSDRDPDERKESNESSSLYMKIEAAKILIDAAKELDKPDLAKAAMAELETVKPKRARDTVQILSLRAKYAETQGRKLDALTMYRAALTARPSDMKPAKDEIADHVERLYKELGGTDAARELWDKQDKKVEAAEDGRWEKPSKPMPEWQLQDLAGKMWKLTSLEGKTVLINVWATWCGPCRIEHPYLEKLYQKVKDRPDIQIVSFNVDDEVGKVQPYMQEQKFTFPVLLAKNYVDELLPALSIPRNWIVDSKGKWRLEQIGFGHDENWEKLMLEKIGQAKPE